MKSKYKPYPSYRDSGIEWLGEVPIGWDVRRLKTILQERKEKNSPVKTKDILSLCMYRGVIPYSEKGNSGNKAKDDLTAYKLAYPNDIVLNSMNVVAGSVGLSKYFGAVSPVYYMLYPRKSTDDISYFNAIFQSESFQKSLIGLGNGILVKQSEKTGKLNTIRMKISMDSLNDVLMPIPPFQEQQTIANYLDNATAKIDTLIEKQTKLIALLKEKRQAVISTAVTRGLDSSVPMKDSGIEWLGKIPKHWRLPQVSRILILMEQGKSPECDSSKAELDEWGVLKTSCVNNAIYDSEKNKKLPSSIKPFTQYEVKEENILMSRASGSIDLIGSVAYVYKTRAKILLSDKIFRLYVDNSVNKIFFTYLMASDYMRTNIKMAISGGEGMANNIAKSSITRFKIALPPIEEQKIILIYIDKITTKIDNLITKSTKAIDLLKEKRTALVSSAVTGKIDVRKAS